MSNTTQNLLSKEFKVFWKIVCFGAFLALHIVLCLAKSPMMKETVIELYQSSLIVTSIAFSVTRLAPLFSRKIVQTSEIQKSALTFCCLTLLYGYLASRCVYFVF